jgi:predicted RNA-binding protein with PUA-like domain
MRYTSAVPNYWLVKSEPSAYSWDDLVRERETSWTGVRNFMARKNLRAMRRGDEVLFYHSVTEKAVIGIASVAREAYPDSTAKEGDWAAVDLKPERALKRPVSLQEVKGHANLKEMMLLRSARLSVQPVTAAEFAEIVRLGS